MASTYTMVAYGSQGSAVRQLQNELNKRGYSLDQDGIFGKKTRAAVRDYQKKNGLTMVDGIAGDETWGSLLSAPTAAGRCGSRGGGTQGGGHGGHGAASAGAGEGLYAVGRGDGGAGLPGQRGGVGAGGVPVPVRGAFAGAV